MSYDVTIGIETFWGSRQWVARDEDGAWRSYCRLAMAKTATMAAVAMFHADEFGVDSQTPDGTRAVITIEGEK